MKIILFLILFLINCTTAIEKIPSNFKFENEKNGILVYYLNIPDVPFKYNELFIDFKNLDSGEIYSIQTDKSHFTSKAYPLNECHFLKLNTGNWSLRYISYTNSGNLYEPRNFKPISFSIKEKNISWLGQIEIDKQRLLKVTNVNKSYCEDKKNELFFHIKNLNFIDVNTSL